MKKLLTLSGLLLIGKLALASSYNLGIASVSVAGNYLLKTGDTMTGTLVVPNATVTYGITAATGAITSTNFSVGTSAFKVNNSSVQCGSFANQAGADTKYLASSKGLWLEGSGVAFYGDGLGLSQSGTNGRLWINSNGGGACEINNLVTSSVTICNGGGNTLIGGGFYPKSVTSLPTTGYTAGSLIFKSNDTPPAMYYSTETVTGVWSWKKY
jgi:hypothetical protein